MHKYYTRLMSLALDDEATAAQKADLQRHLATCRACATTWAHWQVLDARLASVPRLASPPDFVTQVVARLEERRLRQRRRRWIGLGVLVAWGGIALASGLFLAGLLLWGLLHPLEGSLFATWGARLLSNLFRLFDVFYGCLGLVAGPFLGLGAAFCVILTIGLALLWVWVVSHSGRWPREGAPVRG